MCVFGEQCFQLFPSWQDLVTTILPLTKLTALQLWSEMDCRGDVMDIWYESSHDWMFLYMRIWMTMAPPQYPIDIRPPSPTACALFFLLLMLVKITSDSEFSAAGTRKALWLSNQDGENWMKRVQMACKDTKYKHLCTCALG